MQAIRIPEPRSNPADLHQRALYVLDAFRLIEESFERNQGDTPIFALVEAFRPIAESVCEDIERMGERK